MDCAHNLKNHHREFTVFVASGLAGHDFLQLTTPTLPHAYWFATPENEWQELFHPYIPEHLIVSNKTILTGYYEGKADFYQKDIIMAWLGPTLWWTSLFFALGLMMICMNVLVRKQWTEHEKLAYPIIQQSSSSTPLPNSVEDKFQWLLQNKVELRVSLRIVCYG
ncbi:MAG: hypothetical protein H8E17_06340 [Deltaproteobacteria bacterium]|nr:hypothetical protein [Deltaproteobacteria bacterium]